MNQKLFREIKAFRFKRFTRRPYGAFNSMHRLVNIGVLTGSMLTFVHATQTSAQKQITLMSDSIQEQNLKEVTVTASRAELKQEQTAKLITVITREDIAQQPAQSIQDLLKSIVGIDVRQRGANGVQTDISMRGGTFDQMAILLNGANLTNPQTGHYSFDLPVNLSDIERIEIIQGPSSLLYGASAFSGGINIVTKKTIDSNLFLDASGGMHQLLGLEGHAGGKLKSSSHQLSAAHRSSDGYMDNSDYKVFNSLWQSNFELKESQLDLHLGYNSKAYGANTFYSAAYPNQFDDTKSIFAAVKGKTGKQLLFTPQLYWNRHYDCFQLFRDGTVNIPTWYKGHNYHRSDVYGLNLNFQVAWKWGMTSFGGELRNEGILSNVLGKPMKDTIDNYTKSDNRSNADCFAEHSFLFEKITFTMGLLANYNTAVESLEFYPNLNASYKLSDRLKFYASWNTAVRMPTFTDLYYTTKTHAGNSELLPEKSNAYEVGVNYRNTWWTVYLTGFFMQGKDIIDWVKETPDALWESRNLTSLNKTGLETGLTLRLQELLPALTHSSLSLGYMYLNQTKDAGELISNYALDYLKHKLTAQLNHPLWKGASLDWQFRWQDRQGSYTLYENYKPAREVPYAAYSILDCRVNWKMKNLTFYLSVNNLFNINYNDLGNVPQPGFWLSGGVRVAII